MNSSCSHCTINLLRTVEMNRRFGFSFGLFVSRNGVCPPLWIAHGYVKSANMAEKIAFGSIFLQKGRFYGLYKHLIPSIYPPEMNKQKFYNKSAEQNVKIGLMNGLKLVSLMEWQYLCKRFVGEIGEPSVGKRSLS